MALTSVELPPSAVCPTGWNCADVGQVSPAAGGQTLSGGTWTVAGGGGDIFGTADSFHLVWQPLPADGSVTARADSQVNTNAAAKAGVMIRASTDPGSSYYGIFVTPGGNIIVQSRDAQGDTTAQDGAMLTGAPPVFLRVTRTGTTFTAYTSADGSTWAQVPGSSVSLPGLAGGALGGMAVTSHDTSKMSTAVFDTVSVG